MPDPTLEAIVEAARKRWPEATWADLRISYDLKGDDAFACSIEVGDTDTHGEAEAAAPAALLAKLKGEEGAK